MEIDDKTGELKIDSNEASFTESDNVDEKGDKAADELNVSELTITDDSETTEKSKSFSPEPNNSSASKPNAQRKQYKLTAVVCQIINGNQKNLVALIRVGKRYQRAKIGDYDTSSDGEWCIFNDFR